MLKQHQTLADLQHSFSNPGRLEWIGLRSAQRAAMVIVETAELLTGAGIVGDHKASRFTGGNRQVTLIQAEHLAVIASLCQRDRIDPGLLRRNLVVSGINLQGMKNRQFRVGAAILEGSGNCHPCSRMEENLGRGGYNAVRGHGGITARIIQGGKIHLGDHVELAVP